MYYLIHSADNCSRALSPNTADLPGDCLAGFGVYYTEIPLLEKHLFQHFFQYNRLLKQKGSIPKTVGIWVKNYKMILH